MNFQSLHYLVFLGLLALALHTVVRGEGARKGVLLVASYVFYMHWDWRFAGLLVVNTLIHYHAARAIAASDDPVRRKRVLWAAAGAGLGILVYFKYLGFFVSGADALLRALGLHADLPLLSVVLPVGISFFTFQSLSCTIDVYRGKQQAPASLLDFAVFASFFPTLLAGPITRAHQLLPQISSPAARPRGLEVEGMALMVRGFVKKIAFADVLATHLVNPAFAQPEAYSPLFLLIAVYAYSYQIYMDLSGYTDLARGSAQLLGFRLPENFNRPYQAKAVSNFWQRWHISMSSFFRDYLYFGLGGSKHGNTYVNLLLTFVAIGIWHGAGLNFVIYGLVHGSVVAFERWRRLRTPADAPAPAPWRNALALVSTFHIVALSRILFRAPDLASAGRYVKAMLGGGGSAMPLTALGTGVLATAFVLHYLPVVRTHAAFARLQAAPAWMQAAGLVGVTYALLALGIGSAPFVYFRF